MACDFHQNCIGSHETKFLLDLSFLCTCLSMTFSLVQLSLNVTILKIEHQHDTTEFCSNINVISVEKMTVTCLLVSPTSNMSAILIQKNGRSELLMSSALVSTVTLRICDTLYEFSICDRR